VGKEYEAMDIRVYDWQGNERDMAYLKAKYGDFLIHAAPPGEGPVYRVSALREKVDTAAALVVRVTSQDGQPMEGVAVAWYWPDAPIDPLAGPQGGIPSQMRPQRAVTGLTNMSGDTGFGMGTGAYYWPDEGRIGPHAAWIHGQTTRSDVVFGLGMVGETNHDHFDVEFVQVAREEPDYEWPREEILAELAHIEEAILAIRKLIG
jgi:hypothetical protein